MIPKECKRLIEVDFPIAEVSKQSAREKSIRHGHPSTLHLWWARRPLAACRSVLMGLLLPDPCDEACPTEFKEQAYTLLKKRYALRKNDETLREYLLKFIAEFSNWDNSTSPLHLDIGRGLVKAAQGDEPPLVVDPFAGGGSIPIEALRVGCDAFATDLNPVACLINKVLLEDIPGHGTELSNELRRVGAKIKAEVDKDVAELYPPDADKSRPIAYLWARTATCEAPNCGAEIPLMRTFWLSKKRSRQQALRPTVIRAKGKTPRVEFEIFQPKSDSQVSSGTVSRGNAKCLCCGTVLPVARVRQQFIPRRGGADDARLLAVVTLNENNKGRQYRVACKRDYAAIERASHTLARTQKEMSSGLRIVPNELISLNEIRRVSVPLYGATTWGDLFNVRQKVYLTTLTRLISSCSTSAPTKRLLGCVLDRLVMLMSAHCRWKPSGETLIDMFGRHAIGMVWDYAEASPTQSSGDLFENWTEEIAAFVEHQAHATSVPGKVDLEDAENLNLADASAHVWFTDPPYYDSIPYSHLADCFYVWLRRAFAGAAIDQDFSTSLIAKENECVVDRPHRLSASKKNRSYFEMKMGACALEGRRVLSDSGIGCVVFAHKTTEGWESLLSAFIRSGWMITASWPVATELATRLNARDTASLGTSVHLICRPRDDSTGIGDWGDILRELPNRIGNWMERLHEEGIQGADLLFSCIGPALELFSRYERVETPEGRPVELAEYLEKIWEVVGRTALEQVLGTAEARARNGAAGVLEEDARLTALFLWTLMSSSSGEPGQDDDNDNEDEDGDDDGAGGRKKTGYSLPYDVARRFAQPLGIDLEIWKERIIEMEKGIVRLIPVKDRAKQLFGDKGSAEIAAKLERSPDKTQLILFPSEEIGAKAPALKASRKKEHRASQGTEGKPREATTLDRVHAAMLLQATGKSAALKALIEAEQKRSPDFVRLANALSALYPKSTEEKRLLDAMLLAVPRR